MSDSSDVCDCSSTWANASPSPEGVNGGSAEVEGVITGSIDVPGTIKGKGFLGVIGDPSESLELLEEYGDGMLI